MPEEDSKEQLKKIATWIWANDENNDFGYLDYMRIGFLVNKNITYDYECLGKKYAIMEKYNMRRGECAHLTQLTSALLFSFGIKVLYIYGYCIKDNGFKFDFYGLHTYSLIKLKDNKWYHFDSTWSIFAGKLDFTRRTMTWTPDDIIDSYTEALEGKFIK